MKKYKLTIKTVFDEVIEKFYDDAVSCALASLIYVSSFKTGCYPVIKIEEVIV